MLFHHKHHPHKNMLQLLLFYLSFVCHKQGSAVLNQPSPVACSGAFLIYTQTSTDKKMHLCKMHIAIPNGASLCMDLPHAGGFSDSGIWGIAG